MSGLLERVGLIRKSPATMVREAELGLKAVLEAPDAGKRKEAQQRLTGTLETMCSVLYGKDDDAKEADPKQVRALAELLFDPENSESGPLAYQLLLHLADLDFEGKKFLTRMVEFGLSHCKDLTVPLFKSHQELLSRFVAGYVDDDAAIAQCCDTMLRACIRDEKLCEEILRAPMLIQPFFKYLELPSFEVQSHAWTTFKLLLTEHKELAAAYLRRNYEAFVASFNRLLQSKNYVTKCEAFKLLGELLVVRANFQVMVRYVNDPDNLKLSMLALKGAPAALQLDVFHVLKLFIANPEKSAGVQHILTLNKAGLINFVSKLMADSEDERLLHDKREVLTQLHNLPNQPPAPAPTTSTAAAGPAAGPAGAAPSS